MCDSPQENVSEKINFDLLISLYTFLVPLSHHTGSASNTIRVKFIFAGS